MPLGLAVQRSCREEFHELPGRENADAVKIFQNEQVIIAGYDNIGLGRQRSGQHHIIVGVAADWLGKGRGDNELTQFHKGCQSGVGAWAEFEFPFQRGFKFGLQRRGPDDLTRTSGFIHNVLTDSFCSEGRVKNVRIK